VPCLPVYRLRTDWLHVKLLKQRSSNMDFIYLGCLVPTRPTYFNKISTFGFLTSSKQNERIVQGSWPFEYQPFVSYLLNQGQLRATVSVAGEGNYGTFSSSPPRPDRLWGPLSLLSNGCGEIFPRGKAAGA
jgi:hypothetical protein